MSFFPLRYLCTIQSKQTGDTDRSGQEVYTYTDKSSPKCLYLTTSGGSKSGIREEFQAVVVLYLEAAVDIQEGDRVINIRTKSGQVIEPGPYEVENVKRTPGLSGRLHHLTVKLKGEA